jgi:hypothetical protein
METDYEVKIMNNATNDLQEDHRLQRILIRMNEVSFIVNYT